MEPVTSKSVKLPVVNDNCVLRRNVSVQPYGRCSICTLRLPQCHAWQSSAMSFLLVILLLIPLVTGDLWAVRIAIAGALALLVLQGAINHKRTDELISGYHKLNGLSEQLREQNVVISQARDGLEREVRSRTESLREANAALALANLELSALAEQREKMVLDVSHDLRTPLTAVSGAAQNLLDGIAGPLSASQREYVEIVRDHAERLVEAVTKLLDRARAASVGVELHAAPVELRELASDVLSSLQPLATQRGIHMSVHGEPASVAADRAKLRQVLENLVGNALKFTERGGEVSINIERNDSDAILTVRDTGVGMEKAQLTRVFDRFFRANEPKSGTGLGLHIARDLVRLHRGDICVKSTAGAGSEFAVSLPRGGV